MIFHIAKRSEWNAAEVAGEYVAPSLASEGFIHCSTSEQVLGSAERYYRGQSGLVLLCIDEGGLTSPLRYENRFPHIYGPLNIDAVTRVVDFPCEADGSFRLPAACELSKPLAT